MWLRDIKNKTLSPPLLGQWPPILTTCYLTRDDNNHPVTWLIYHAVPLYSQKCASPVSQRQWPLNFVGLWVRVKRPHLLFQVTCRSSDQVLFEKRHVTINARPQNLDISKHRKTHKSKLFLLFKRYLNWIHINIHHFKDI